jgi:CBS domain containing-hemolysin-like protein
MIHRLMGRAKEAPLFLSREEVRAAFEEHEEGEDDFNILVGHIFKLKNLTAGQLMIPLEKVEMAPSHTTLIEIRHMLSVRYAPMIPIYHRYLYNIVAIVNLRDLLKVEDKKRIIEQARSPWFVTKDTSILQILEQFRRNNQSIAVILETSGVASGILTLDQIVAEIFGEETKEAPIDTGQIEYPIYIDRTLSGEMSVVEFNSQFRAKLPLKEGDTLSDLLVKELGHPPVKGESVRIGGFFFIVEEPTLRGAKIISVQTVQE